MQVFGSIYRVLKDLQRDGYDVGQLPMNEEALIKSVLTQVCLMLRPAVSMAAPLHGLLPVWVCPVSVLAALSPHAGLHRRVQAPHTPASPPTMLTHIHSNTRCLQAEAKFNSADLNIAYKMSVDEYQKLCP